MEKKIEKLANDIWTTRKCRILASERLNANERFCRFISIYYSILTTILTIINMSSIESRNLDIVILIFSITVTNFLLYLDTQNYKDRYLALKKNYLDLDKLQIKINSLDDVEDINKYREIAIEYNNLLREVENHKEYDYIKLALVTKELKDKIGFKKKFIYYLKFIFNWLLKVIIIMLPAIFVLIQATIIFEI